MTVVEVVPGVPSLDQPHDRAPDSMTRDGTRTWSLRGDRVVVSIIDLAPHDRLTEQQPDEHVVLVPGPIGLLVDHDVYGRVEVAEPAVVVVPAGTSTLCADSATRVVRILATRDPGSPGSPDRAVRPGLRVHPLRTVPVQSGRLGRIFRTASLMVNWFPDQDGPRDTEALSPHAHADFDQVSVTLEGDYVHHLRTPWTPRMSTWRDDQHLAVGSPSMLRIPPSIVHTTRAVGSGRHSLVDVFAPPRADFLARGWVLNAEDYLPVGDDQRRP